MSFKKPLLKNQAWPNEFPAAKPQTKSVDHLCLLVIYIQVALRLWLNKCRCSIKLIRQYLKASKIELCYYYTATGIYSLD